MNAIIKKLTLKMVIVVATLTLVYAGLQVGRNVAANEAVNHLALCQLATGYEVF